MAFNGISFADALGAFAPGHLLRAALFLTYNFDGVWFEEAVAPVLFERPVETALVLRDRQALVREAPSVRNHRTEAAFSQVFHTKLALFVAEDRARAILGSANLTRGGFERNLELGSVFDIHPEGGCRSFFKALLAYLGGPLRQEVGGGGLRALEDVAVALREIVSRAPSEREGSPHLLLHNYDRPLWEQLLAKLPHRRLCRALIVSPFYEPDAAGRAEDPPGQADDSSLFQRLFSDFEFDADADEAPVTVCFEEDAGITVLPVSKLRAWKERLNLQRRLATSDDARRLHGKLLVLEGSGKKGREAFLVALHGSPNFTSAALLRTPPEGNAELAVLTRLPPRGGSTMRVATTLALGKLFGAVSDWDGLRSTASTPLPRRGLAAFTLTDATFQVVGRTVVVSARNLPSGAVNFRLSALVEGTWLPLAGGVCDGSETWSIPTAALATCDPETKLLTVRATRVRVEILSGEGAVLAADEAPLNVDCPEQFCGLAMVGPLLLTLDQRIAQAGAGAPMTYREQQKWLERFRQQQGGPGGMALPSHQADLDRFFRNLHAGMKGLHRRLEASRRSEFVLRNVLRQLSRWCTEAIAPDGKVATPECRIFLLDRLSQGLLAALERAAESPALATRVSASAGELGLGTAVQSSLAWLSTTGLPDTAAYLRKTRRRFNEVQRTLERLGK
jgi:hypothetical protein